MKIFLAVCAIVAVLQMSSAAPLERSKRDSTLELGESSYMFFGMAAVNAVKSSEYALEKMPETEAYAPYRKELGDFVASVKAGKLQKGNCFTKVFKAFEKFEEITKHYEQEDAPAEAKEVQKLLDEAFDEKTGAAFANMFVSLLKYMVLEGNDEADEAKRKEFEKLMEEEC